MAIVQVGRLTLVNDVIAYGSRLRGIIVVVSVSTLAFVPVFPVNAIRESTAVVHRRVGAFVNLQEALTSGSVAVWGLVNSVDWAPTSVSFGVVFANGNRVAVVQASIEAFVNLLHTDSPRAMSFVRTLINVPVTASTSKAFFVLGFTANSSGMAIVSVGVEANRLGKDTDTSGLVFDVW